MVAHTAATGTTHTVAMPGLTSCAEDDDDITMVDYSRLLKARACLIIFTLHRVLMVRDLYC